MNTPFDGQHDARQLSAWASAVCEGTIDDEQLTRLESWLADSPAARLLYVQHLEIHFECRRLALESARDELPAEEVTAEVAPITPLQRGGLLTAGLRYLSQPLHFSVFFASVATISLLAFFAQIRVPLVDDEPSWPPAADVATAPPTTAQQPWVARLANTRDLAWGEAGAQAGRSRWRVGDAVELTAGLAEIQLDSGVRIVVEAPAQLTFEAENAVTLARGRLSARIETPAAQGFRVQTPLATIIDLGTEFGVAVQPTSTEVHVYAGRVEVQRRVASGSTDAVEQLVAGQAVEITAEREALQIVPADVTRFTRSVPPRGTNATYVVAVLEARPLLHWSLEGVQGGAIFDATGRGNHGRLAGGATPDQFEPTPFGQGLVLQGEQQRVEIPAALAEPFHQTFTGFTLELWLRPTSAASGKYTWIAGKQGGQFQRGWALRTRPSGELKFSVWDGPEGRETMVDVEQRTLPTDRFTHVAAVFAGGERAALYLDGKLAAQQSRAAGNHVVAQLNAANQLPLQIGNRGDSAYGAQDQSFHGLIDEVSLYDRALSEAEIAAHWNAGQATKSP